MKYFKYVVEEKIVEGFLKLTLSNILEKLKNALHQPDDYAVNDNKMAHFLSNIFPKCSSH